MKYQFELYILNEQLLPEHWAKLYKALLSYLGVFSKFELMFRCTDNVVRFFISSDKDLGSLSNNIEGLLLRPVDKEDMKLPIATSKDRFVNFVAGGNLLDLKEKTTVKKTRDLEFAVFKVRAINIKKCIVRSSLYFKNAGDRWSKASKVMSFFPTKLFSIDFETNTHYLKKTVTKYLDIEKSLHMLVSNNVDALFEIDTFPYFSHNYYLNLMSYEFDKHSFIIGASGSGKSKLIGLFVDRLYRTALKNDYRVVIIDPHSSIASDFAHIPESKVINFSNESAELFGGSTSDISAATELTTTLFKSLMGDQFNSKTDRVLRFSLFTLFTAQNMSLDTLRRFITETDLRNQILEHVSGFVPANIVHFFGADFNEMRTKYYNEAVSPIVSLVDEMQMQPVLVGEGELSLTKTIQENFLTVFSLNKVSMGDKVVKTVAGLLVQQIFLLAQARAFTQKVILIIDEVSVVQNPAIASMLAEARKFNLTVILSQQYFGQIEKDLRDAIFANVYNYYTFKVSEEDARSLEGNLNIELPKEIVEEAHKKGHKEQDLRIKIMTELHPRECLVRVLSNGQVAPALKARTLDAPNAVPSSNISTDELKAQKQAPVALPKKFNEKQAILSGYNQETAIQIPSSKDNKPEPSASKNTEPSHDIVRVPKPNGGNYEVVIGKIATHAHESDQETKLKDSNSEIIIDKTEHKPPPKSAGLFNLTELLSQNSSSRLNKKEQKDKL